MNPVFLEYIQVSHETPKSLFQKDFFTIKLFSIKSNIILQNANLKTPSTNIT